MAFLLIAFFAIASNPLSAQQTSNIVTDTIKVNGNCGSCKNRIEKSLNMKGISSANWDKETKLLIVTYNKDKISNDVIQKKVASIGYDTEKYRAEDIVYGKLPGCCQYDRETEIKTVSKSDITDSIQVNGVCGMCKSRIQNALKVEGVSDATWDKETKILRVTYNPEIITNDAIQKKIAAVGHDTEQYKADDKVYDKLPACCQYDRSK